MDIAGSVRFLCVLGATLAVLCSAKPYDQYKDEFDEELPAILPERPPAKWMSWDPEHKHPMPQYEVKEQLGDKKKETQDEEKQTDTKEKPIEEKQPIASEAERPSTLPQFSDPCKSIFCHFGRVCKVNVQGYGECVCGEEDYCQGHNKKVCGSDGVVYPSHCELHRMACVKNMHIGIDHTSKTCDTFKAHKRMEHVVEPKLEVKVEKLNLESSEEKVEKESSEEDKKPTEEAKKEDGEEYSEDEEDEDEEYEKMNYDRPYATARLCTDLEYEQLKSNLLQYHCARIGEEDCAGESPRKQFVANIMFSYYDRNDDQKLGEPELTDVERRDHLEKLSQFCSLTDMLAFDDKDEDGNISLTEFYKALRVPTVILDDNLRVFTTTVTSGSSIELKCDIKGAEELVWKRNGAIVLESPTTDLKTFSDGSLYISNLGLHHMGNYTCQDRYEDHTIQTHVLKVQMAPRVRVSPSTQFHTSGSSVTLKCHADGIPEPEITWEMNEAPLTDDALDRHYLRLHNNATLEIHKAVYTKDTGAYKCKARNSAGTSQDIATVFIENAKVPKYSVEDELYEVFVVFHDKGYTVYEPSHCHIKHQVSAQFSGFKILPEYGDTVPTLCGADQPCSWGSAVNVANKFIYITQPKMNRVIVIEIQDRSNPIEVIPTDKVPVDVQYVEHLDQVWVTCWNDPDNTATKTALVIRQASQPARHHTVHTQPVANHFDLIKDVFLPPNNDLKHKFSHGYVVHNEQRGLYKLDLEAMKYIKNIDLNKYNCVPKSLAFIPLGGQILVHCTSPVGESGKSGHLVLDYVTDAVLHYSDLSGEPYVSPDGRFLVIIDDAGDTITVHRVRDDGHLEKLYDEYTNLHISDVTFFPAERGRSYDFYASSSNKNDVLYMNLASGKVEMIEGVGQAIDVAEWPWNKHNRVIVNGGVFGEFLMTPSRDSVVIIDGKRRHVQCEWQDIQHGNVIVWVEPLHL